MELKGKCLCGKIGATINVEKVTMHACHCNMCRKWNGGPAMSMQCNTPITWQGQENIKIYDSSAWAERAFCEHCGTHLFYHLKGTTEHYFCVWFFDNLTDISFEGQVYIDKKPACYSFADKTHNLTEADIMELVQSKGLD